jgi:ParB-like chromosome segregation protein Spo0J
MTRKVNATRQRIKLPIAQQHEVDPAKVAALVDHLKGGGSIPPVVVAKYRGFVLPLDGHHRMLACEALGCDVDAWVVPGSTFDRLCCTERNAESFILCGGVPAMQVAP